MVYLNRFVRGSLGIENRFWVVDTDDDVENELNFAQLREIVCGLKMKIEGVDLRERLGEMYHSTCIPYQDQRYLKPLQVKAKTLLGWDIHRYKDEITYIGVDCNLAKSITTIRLSDYGKSMYWGSEVQLLHNNNNSTTVVLVIEDNVEMLGPFIVRQFTGPIFDIRCVTDDAVAATVYSALVKMSSQVWERYVIDRVDRVRFWRESIGGW